MCNTTGCTGGGVHDRDVSATVAGGCRGAWVAAVQLHSVGGGDQDGHGAGNAPLQGGRIVLVIGPLVLPVRAGLCLTWAATPTADSHDMHPLTHTASACASMGPGNTHGIVC